jgi:hypothetical protein
MLFISFAFLMSVIIAIAADFYVFRWNRHADFIFWSHCLKTANWVAVMFALGVTFQEHGLDTIIATVAGGAVSIVIYSMAVAIIRAYVGRNARRGFALAIARLENDER